MKSTSPFSWFESLPIEWQERKTKYLFSITKQQVEHKDQQILSITQQGVKPKETRVFEGQMAQNYDGYQILRHGDFAMNSMDLLTGWVDQSKFDGLTSPDYRVFRASDLATIDARYFLYVFQLLYLRRVYYRFGQGVSNKGRWRLPASVFRNIPLPLPQKDEQAKIVCFLDEKTAEIEISVEQLKRQIELLEKYRRELIAHTVTRGLDDSAPMRDSGIDWSPVCPSSWKNVPAKALFERRKGFEDEGDVHLTPSQMYGVLPQEEFIEKSGTKPTLKLSDTGKMRHVEPGDFIIHLRSFQGGLEFSSLRGKVSSAYTVLKVRDEAFIESGYFRWLFKSQPFISALSSLTNQLRDGQSINFSTFGKTSYVLPPYSEQQAIATFLDQKTAAIDTAIANIRKQIELLATYRKQLINDVVTGKIRVGELS